MLGHFRKERSWVKGIRASLIVQLVKNPLAMQETLVRFLGWEDPLEKSRLSTPVFLGFPCGSADKESACNVGDLGSIPGLGRSTGEGIGYSVQYSWSFLVAQLVKNPPEMREIWVQSPGWEDILEKGKVTHASTVAWRISWTV